VLEYAAIALIAFVLGTGVGVFMPFTARLPMVGRCSGSSDGEHNFNQLKGYYAYCQFCSARKRNG
jgi:hypothetical protein